METALFLSLLAHFAGDYLLQNDWMAANKTKSSLAAFVHALTYSLPFLLIVGGWSWFLIFSTHFLIDRYRLATYWIKLVNWNWNTPIGYAEDKPIWLSVWLMIIIDNTFHILINSLAVYLYVTMR